MQISGSRGTILSPLSTQYQQASSFTYSLNRWSRLYYPPSPNNPVTDPSTPDRLHASSPSCMVRMHRSSNRDLRMYRRPESLDWLKTSFPSLIGPDQLDSYFVFPCGCCSSRLLTLCPLGHIGLMIGDWMSHFNRLRWEI